MSSDIDNFSVLLKSWSDKNWKETLFAHKDEVAKAIEYIETLNIWKKRLKEHYPAAKLIIPEIISDAIVSIKLSCEGLYKYSIANLRSQIENYQATLYFAFHEIELNWWQKGKTSKYLKSLDFWGDQLNYFDQLEDINEFNALLKEKKHVEQCPFEEIGINLGQGIYLLKRTLSTFIHNKFATFQSSTGWLNPIYSKDRFIDWFNFFEETIWAGHLLFILGFKVTFLELNLEEKTRILNQLPSRFQELVKQYYLM